MVNAEELFTDRQGCPGAPKTTVALLNQLVILSKFLGFVHTSFQISVVVHVLQLL